MSPSLVVQHSLWSKQKPAHPTSWSKKKPHQGHQKPAKPLAFLPWMLQQANRTDRVGELAALVAADPCWPKRSCFGPVARKHMAEHDAEPKHYAALDRAIGEWRRTR